MYRWKYLDSSCQDNFLVDLCLWKTGLSNIYISLAVGDLTSMQFLGANQQTGEWFVYILIKGHQQRSLSPPSGLMVLQMPQEYTKEHWVYYRFQN